MFLAAEAMSFTYMLAGIIWSLALGFAAGNYACSLVHRLPRGRLLLDKTPYCGNCGTLLKVKDLFPVISALMLRHRCRYCGQPFPTSHTWTEILVGLLFVSAFLQFDFSEAYVLVVGLGVFLITLAAIEVNENLIMTRVLVCGVIFGMLYRVLLDHSIYPFFFGGLYGLMLGVILKRREVKKVGHVYVPPKLAELFAVGGICVGENGLLTFLTVFAASYILLMIIKGMKKPVHLTIPFGIAVSVPLLFPQFIF